MYNRFIPTIVDNEYDEVQFILKDGRVVRNISYDMMYGESFETVNELRDHHWKWFKNKLPIKIIAISIKEIE